MISLYSKVSWQLPEREALPPNGTVSLQYPHRPGVKFGGTPDIFEGSSTLLVIQMCYTVRNAMRHVPPTVDRSVNSRAVVLEEVAA